MRPHLNAGWLLAAHRCELLQPGDFVNLPICWPASELVVANVEGQVHAFPNACPHRGARIYTDLAGNMPPVCRYHGRLLRPEQTKTYHTRWAGDWLFVCVADDMPALEDAFFLHDSPPPRRHSTLQYVYPCHWRVAVENAIDNEHVAHVHAASLARLGLSRTSLVTRASGSSCEFFASQQSPRLDAIGRTMPCSDAFDYAHALLYPWAAVSSTRGWIYSLQHYFPRQDGKTSFVSRLFVQADAPPHAAALFDQVAAVSAQVFREDAEVCALLPVGDVGKLGPADDRVAHFRRDGYRG